MPFAGWEWAVPPLLVLAWMWLGRRDSEVRGLGWTLAPGLLWLALFLWTGDRRLYFCYTMLYAVQLARLRRMQFRQVRGWGRAAGAGFAVIAAFLGIRIWQDATAAVLIVELLVAAGVLELGIVWRGGQPETPAQRAMVSLAASLAAFAGLAL